ncbi:hypothetical protein HY488_02535 [Candidatus Woesearchaeota archaeon]|nr:hypothetical protein [Candidatus Woesearchaeota archaeon]
MEKTEEAREKAIKNLKIANHLLTQSYPLLNDPKLLVAVLQNIFLAQVNAMTAIVSYDHDNWHLPAFPDNFDAKFDLFKLKIAPKYKIPAEHLQAILDVKALIASQKESKVSFVRKDAFVICEEGYRLKTLTLQDMKTLLAKTKVFIQRMGQILAQE